MAASSTGSGPRYAPHDPSLPPPWRALVDGSTGYIYYWNQETNLTQYEKPPPHAPPLPAGPPPPPGTVTTGSKASSLSNGSVGNADAQSCRPANGQPDKSEGNVPASAGGSTRANFGRSIIVGADGNSHRTGGGNAYGSNAVSTQGAVHGSSGGSSRGVVQGSAGGSSHGVVLGNAGASHGLVHGSSGGAPLAGVHGAHASSGGPLLGGGVHVSSGGPSQGGVQVSSTGLSHGAVHVSLGGPSQGGVQVSSTGLSHGAVHASSGGPSQGGVQVSSTGLSHGTVHGSFGGSSQGGAHASSTGLSHGAVHGSSGVSGHGTLPGNSGRSVHGAMHGSSGGSGHGAMHGSLGGKLHGTMPGSLHGNSRAISSFQGQPKLAVIPVPRGQQNLGAMHTTPQSTAGHGQTNFTGPPSSSSLVPGTGSMPVLKRSASSFVNNDQDPYKRPRVQGFTDAPPVADVHAYRRQHEVSALGDNVPDPFMTFEAAAFPSELLRELRAAGFSSPTPIQAQSWPIVLQDRDIVAIAKTGSGKTLGYLLPAFLHLRKQHNNSQLGPTVLVLAPTRELATQIQDEVVKFGRSSRISSTCVYGGAPKGGQLHDLERGADIVIATPGRLNDFLEMRKVSLRQVTYLVLDEADRMLDMGFEPQIRKIVNEIPPRRQTLMYTATWPKEVRKIAGDLLVNPVQVNIGSTDELSANKSITQHVEMVPPYEKQRRLEQILRSQGPGSKVIIFCSTKKMCDQLARTLGRDFGAAVIHGDKSQSERDYVLAQFKSGRSPVLVATDVAARGLDIKDIRIVINFDFPTGVEDYVHRIGRTGRAGATGISYTFFSEQDAKYGKELIKVLEGAGQKVPLELREIAGRSSFIKGRGGRWDSGGRGGRDGGRSSYAGGRVDTFGGRGPALAPPTSQYVDRRDRNFDRFPDRERFDRDVRRDRYNDDRYRSREAPKGFSEKSRSYSRSYSRSPTKSRSRSFDRFSDGHNHRSPYRGGNSHRSRSPYRVPSPHHGGSPYRSPLVGDNPRYGGAPLRSRSPYKGVSPFRSVPSPRRGRSPARSRSPNKVDMSQQKDSPPKGPPVNRASPLPAENSQPNESKNVQP